MSLEICVAAIIMVSLTFYVLMAGADYGGGVWDMLASGPRAVAQKALIAHVMGPIWEANHVWLILVLVVLFSAFPAAFTLISVALHVPLTLMLIGIVLRGSAFSFRAYDSQKDAVQRRWSRIFSIASVITPIMLGMCVGAISSGRLSVPLSRAVIEKSDNLGVALGAATSGVAHSVMSYDFFGPWLAPFSIAVGIFALSIFAFLAAAYLTWETEDVELRNDFRRRALLAQAMVAFMALIVFILSKDGAPAIWKELATSWWAWPLQLTTAAVSLTAIFCLYSRRFLLARIFSAGQAACILWGWAIAQFPYLIRPDINIYNAAAPAVTLKIVLLLVAAGSLVLFPSFYYLFKIFQGVGQNNA